MSKGYNMAIIDRDPVDKMDNEMLSFEAERLVATVIDIAEILPGTRNKPLLGVVCGMGGGKTRLIEELRRALLMIRERCGFLLHAVRKVPNATTVVVMVDEILKAEDCFQEKFPLELPFHPASVYCMRHFWMIGSQKALTLLLSYPVSPSLQWA